MPKRGKSKLSRSETAKRNLLLRSLHRQGVASRASLARALEISNSRVCLLIDQMLADGLLAEDHAGGDRRGRKGVAVRLNPEFGQLVGFDMEAKRLRMVVTNFAGEMVWQKREALSPDNRDDAMDEILSFISTGIREIHSRFANPLAFGIAASGVIDAKRGTILHYDLLPHMINIPIRDVIARKIKLPCIMENNIRAMTLAEWVCGAAKGLNSFICVAVRSGVGAGIVRNGRLRSGSHGMCGEIGYMPIPIGKNGECKPLQQLISESALGVDIEADGFAKLSPDRAKRCGEILGVCLASIATISDPEAFVLAGGLLNPQGPVWPHVVQSFRQNALKELAERVHLLPAHLTPYAAAQGAAYRALYEQLFPVGVAIGA